MSSKRYTDRDLAILRNKLGENIPVPAERKKQSNEESRLQQACVTWWRSSCKGLKLSRKLLHSVPNGGHRNVITATIMKREGQERGVFDMKLNVPRNDAHGLWIELKTKDGILSPDQIEFRAAVEGQGYKTAVCRSSDEFIHAVLNYLEP